MLKLISIILCLLAVNSYASVEKIGVIVPLEHAAMDEIVLGIREALADKDVEIIVKNAQGDSNIQLSIINQMRDYDILMPIGTATSQMTIAQVKNKPIICVAAKINVGGNKFITGVNDEVLGTLAISKLPHIDNISLIYSSSEKVASEVEAFKKYAKENNINLYVAMIQTLADLPPAVKNSPRTTKAFLIFKDHLIVSGLNPIINEAKKRFIPVIASDEGSVRSGATLAIGIKEKDNGIEAGLLAKKILEGTKPVDLPYKIISAESMILFINEKALSSQEIFNKENLLNLPFKSVELIDKVR